MRVMWPRDMFRIGSLGIVRDERGILFTYLTWPWHIKLSSEWIRVLNEMRDYYVHSENSTENELIIDHVHESREIN